MKPCPIHLTIAFVVLSLAGCVAGKNKAPATPPPAAVAARENAEAARASWQAAHLDAWLARVPDLTNPDHIRAMLGVLRAANPATPTDTDRKAAERTVDAVAKGDLAAAETATSEATARATAAEVALAAERDARAKAEAALKAEREEHARQLKAAEDSIWRQVQFWGAAVLYLVAIAALVIGILRAKAAIASGLAIVEGIKSTASLLTLSATCFSVARFMAAWWFWWACGGVVVLFLGYLGYLAWMESKGKAARSALTPIRKALDAAYDSADTTERQQDLQKTIFEPIAEEMKKSGAARSFLHIDRAESPAT